ncbi:MAG TPA: hypothetical protein V6C65_16835 [Allocoleopsis sp.]
MDVTRREALKLGLLGTGVLLSALTPSEQAQAAEIGKCAKDILPANSQLPPLSPQIDRFKAPLFIPQPLQPS